MSAFSLKKWYLDAADAQGNVYIGYWASISWKKLNLYGYHHLCHSLKSGTKNHGQFIKQPQPEWKSNTELTWQSKDLRATWQGAKSSIEEIINTGHGEIYWRCLQPKAQANINLSGMSLSGWGYTECIDMNIPIWNLPFKTLYWGRCHTRNHYLVWIKLDGAIKISVIWHNGMRSNELDISDNTISGSDFELKLGKDVPLRQGKLISTVFQPFSEITKLLPNNTFLVNEEKWYNLGILKGKDYSEESITIYEKVSW